MLKHYASEGLAELQRDVKREFRRMQVAQRNVRQHSDNWALGRHRVRDIAVAPTVRPNAFTSFFLSALEQIPSVKNRERLLASDIAEAFCQEVLRAADERKLLSNEHFSVDGTLLEAWASAKSFRPKVDPSPPPSHGDPKNPTVNFKKEKRSNATHQSVTDPAARLSRKSNGTTAKLCHLNERRVQQPVRRFIPESAAILLPAA